MKKILLTITLLELIAGVFAQQPDSVFIKGYATTKNDNKNGLHIAYSTDGKSWTSIGNEYSFLKSDYGRWGSSKKMFDPVLVKNNATEWACYFFTEAEHKVVGVAYSNDLILWKPQDYFLYNEAVTKFPVIGDAAHMGSQNYKLPWQFVQALISQADLAAYKNIQNSVTAQSFAEKNPGLSRLLVGDALTGETERLRQRIVQFFERIESQFKQILREAELRNQMHNVLPPAVFAHLLMAYIDGVLARFVRSEFQQLPTDHWSDQWTALESLLAKKEWAETQMNV